MEHPLISFEPIGHFHTRAVRPYETPRQSGLEDEPGEVELLPRRLLDQALKDLIGFERIWLIYQFHHNEGWKPRVLPPRSPDGQKKGVFATRAPHRPNPIGLSCVVLEAIEGLTLRVRGADLLEGTPILDIKPYVAYADAWPEARQGWLEGVEEHAWDLEVTSPTLERFAWLEQRSELRPMPFLRKHLEYMPLHTRHKRVRPAGLPGLHILSLQTWRFLFRLEEEGRRIRIEAFFSGYSPEDLQAGAEDPHGDKELHRAFVLHWPDAALPEGLEHHRHR